MAHCPDTDPVPQQGFSLSRKKRNARPASAKVDAALECLGSFQRIFINGAPLDPEFDYFTEPDSGVRGIITYLPVERLPKGRNFLRIERVEVDDGKDEPEEDELPLEFFIPFWI